MFSQSSITLADRCDCAIALFTRGERQFWVIYSLRRSLPLVRFTPNRWGNRPARLWIAERFWVLRFRLMVKRGPWSRPQASEGEAQHGPFCWTGRFGQGDQRLYRG